MKKYLSKICLSKMCGSGADSLSNLEQQSLHDHAQRKATGETLACVSNYATYRKLLESV